MTTKLHHYKGFTFEKPEGCVYWNIWKPMKTKQYGVLWCGENIAQCHTIKECKHTVDDELADD